MPKTDSIKSLYDQLDPAERLTLVLEARAGGDKTEERRLRDACPRKVYSMLNVEFADREEMCFARMALACADLRALSGELQMLQNLIDSLDQITQPFQHAATMSFLQGVRYGWGKPYFAFRSIEGEHEDEGESIQEDEETEALEVDVRADGGDGDECDQSDDNDLTRGMQMGVDAAEALANTATDTLRRFLVARAEPIARMLLELWEALERFCQRRLGLDAQTMLAAWGMQRAVDFSVARGSYGHLKLGKEMIARCFECLDAEWVERFVVD